jgi:hypothetical protein
VTDTQADPEETDENGEPDETTSGEDRAEAEELTEIVYEQDRRRA